MTHSSDGWSRRGFLTGSMLAGGSVALSGLASGCGALGFGNSLADIKQAGVVKVGIADERPYAYLRGGNLAGAIPAIHSAIFERIGDIELRPAVVPFKDLLDGLNAGSFDVVAAGMFINSGRCSRAAFSEPTYCAQQALLVPRGNPLRLSDYTSVAKRNATVAVLAGGVEGDYLRSAGVENDRIVMVGSQSRGLQLVASNRVDAFTLTAISLRALLRQAKRTGSQQSDDEETPATQKVELLEPFTPALAGQEQLGCGGAAFRSTDEALLEAFNSGLRALRQAGKLLDLTREYGFTEAEMVPRGVTAQRLCRSNGVTGVDVEPIR